MTAGIVSARNRDINAGPYDDFIQTDAPINRGNSGGPLFDMDGNVMGINSAIFSPSGGSVGIGFAIPANLARDVVAQLRQFGVARRGWIGVRIQQVTAEIAEGTGPADHAGARWSPMSRAAARPRRPGCAMAISITGFDGKPVTDYRALPRMVADDAHRQDRQHRRAAQGPKQSYAHHHAKLAEDAKPDKPGKEIAAAGAGKRTVQALAAGHCRWWRWTRRRAPNTRSAAACRAWW